MEHEKVEGEVARRSVLIYVPLSLGMGAVFYTAASLTGDNSLVARLGGAIWVTLLSFIVSMPMVTARVKKARRL